jgi:hypothetical protein
MSHVQQDESKPATTGSKAPAPAAQTLDAVPAAEGVVVVVHMRPDRIGGGLTDGNAGRKLRKAKGVTKTYKTSTWYFASDFADRVVEVAMHECSGLQVRPVQVELTFALDEKAYRHVGLIAENVDLAFRAL